MTSADHPDQGAGRRGRPAPTIRTVQGDIPPEALGLCDAHDHLFLRSPLLPGQELADMEGAEREVREFAAHGGEAVVQWTPYGMGRRSGALAELARRTGVRIIAATGLHQAAHYGAEAVPGPNSNRNRDPNPSPGPNSNPSPSLNQASDPATVPTPARTPAPTPGPNPLTSHGAWGHGAGDQVPADPARLFVEELTEGMRGGVCGEVPRAGLIKVAGDFEGVGVWAEWTLRAAAEAHHATGAPVAVHLERGTGAAKVVGLLCERLAVPPESVLLGHLGRNPDRRAWREAARSGAWLVFDGPSRTWEITAGRVVESLAELVRAGCAGQLLVGGDTTGRTARNETGVRYVTRVLRPRIAQELGDDLARRVFVENPAQAFAVGWMHEAP